MPKTTYLIMGKDLASTRQTRRHSPSTFARTRQTRRHSPSHVARTRQTRRHSPTAIFEKNVTRLDTFARVIRHFREFGASGHCLVFLQIFLLILYLVFLYVCSLVPFSTNKKNLLFPRQVASKDESTFDEKFGGSRSCFLGQRDDQTTDRRVVAGTANKE